MGKERYWNYNVGGRSSSSSSSSKRAAREKVCSSSNGGGGCMSAMFQLFDFHSFHFPLHHTTTHSSNFKFTSSPCLVDEEKTKLGTEAPRNSLEVDETPLASSNPNTQDNLKFPMGIQIKTRGDKRESSLCSEISSSSPGMARTPTLVARLMGLDLLPDSTSSSPRLSSTLDTASGTPHSLPSHHTHQRPQHHQIRGRKSCSDMESSSGSRSVQETPNISLSRRSDVGHYHCPSLHTNKENNSVPKDHQGNFDFSGLIRKHVNKTTAGEDYELSPGYYARQIVKQVKETVSQRSGISDITNVHVRRDQFVISTQQSSKHKIKLSSSLKNNYCLRQTAAEEETASSPSCSPRLRFLETNHKSNKNCHDQITPQMSKPKPPQQYTKVAAAGEEIFGQRLTRRSVRTPPEVVRPSPAARGNVVADKKLCKKTTTALSSGIRSVGGGVPTVLPIKKDPSPPATKIPAKQQQLLVHDAPQSKNSSHLSSCSNNRHRQIGTHDGDRLIGTSIPTTDTATTKTAELQYLSTIFKCIGIDIDRNVPLPLPLSFTNRFLFTPYPTSYHDFRTTIFSSLSAKDSSVELKCNQKLLVDLVEELIFDFFKPYRNFNPIIEPIQKLKLYGHTTLGLELVEEVKSKVETFPRADCHVLEDINAIIDGDLPLPELKTRTRAVEEEGGDMVLEIERHIWNGLMQEMAAM